MPKRVIDFDALWASDKLAACARWAQAEYAWLYGLADASGSFELTNLRVIWGRAAATPFLAGEGDRGWRASFDWLIGNRSNARKVLAGEYAPVAPRLSRAARAERRGPADLYAGIAPRPADCGVRVNPAALARIREREARLSSASVRTCGSAPALHAMESRAPAAPELAPQPLSTGTQARASPAALK